MWFTVEYALRLAGAPKKKEFLKVTRFQTNMKFFMKLSKRGVNKLTFGI